MRYRIVEPPDPGILLELSHRWGSRDGVKGGRVRESEFDGEEGIRVHGRRVG